MQISRTNHKQICVLDLGDVFYLYSLFKFGHPELPDVLIWIKHYRTIQSRIRLLLELEDTINTSNTAVLFKQTNKVTTSGNCLLFCNTKSLCSIYNTQNYHTCHLQMTFNFLLQTLPAMIFLNLFFFTFSSSRPTLQGRAAALISWKNIQFYWKIIQLS